MAGILYEKRSCPALFWRLHDALIAWAKLHPGGMVRVTDILRHPGDSSLSFLVSFPDSREDELREELGMVDTRVRVEYVTMQWFLVQGRVEDVLYEIKA